MSETSFDVLVVGAGPAGVAAAVSAAQSGARVGLIDDNPVAGGQIWRGGERQSGSLQARRWLQWLRRSATIAVMSSARVVAACRSDALLVETPTSASAVGFQRLILASGARERFLPFPGWTLPGVTGAGGLQALVKGGLPISGKRVVVAGSGPLLLAVAAYLQAAGAQVCLVAEQAPWPRLATFLLELGRSPGKLAQAAQLRWALRRVALKAGCWVSQAHGVDRLEAVTLRQADKTWQVSCDYLACGFGLVPNLELPSALGCALSGDTLAVDAWQQTSRPRIYAAGELTGIGGVDLALVEGQIAGFAATGQLSAARRLFRQRARLQRFAAALEHAFALRAELRLLAEPETIVCRCEDVPFYSLQQHTSWRSAKLQTRCGMGPCQGRVCGAATAFLFGWGHQSIRPPIAPARLSSLTCADSVRPYEEELVQ